MTAANLVLVNAVSAVALPALASLEAGEPRDQAFLRGLTIASIVTAPAFAGLGITAPEIVGVLLGRSWAETSPILAALAISGYFLAIGQFGTMILLVTERSHLDSISSMLVAGLKIAAYCVAVRYGPLALALAVSGTTALGIPIRMRFALQNLGVSSHAIGHALLPSILAATAMATILTVLHRMLPPDCPPPLVLLTLIVSGLFIYVAFMRILSPGMFRTAAQSLLGTFRTKVRV